jgi:arginine/ornithine N-succinyltransferase beta subunit
MNHIGTIEIDLGSGEYLYTEVCREGDKLITGTPTNNTFLRDQWEVSVEEFYSEQEALEELYAMIEESAEKNVDSIEENN